RTMAAATAAATVVPAAVSADSQAGFPDVEKDNDHYDAIMQLTESGTIKGFEDGTFKPWDNITRGQVAAILTKELNLEIPSDIEGALKGYDDVDTDHEYAKYIAAVTEAGVFKGKLNDLFMPFSDISREQMATVLVKGLGLTEYDDGEDVKINLDKVSPDHQKNVQILANLGVTNQLGDTDKNNFNGFNEITRAQFATMLVKSLNVI